MSLEDYKLFQMACVIWHVERKSLPSIYKSALVENKIVELENFTVRFSNEAYSEYQELLQYGDEINKQILNIYKDVKRYMELYQLDITKMIYLVDIYFGIRRIMNNYYVVFSRNNSGEVVIMHIQPFESDAYVPPFEGSY